MRHTLKSKITVTIVAIIMLVAIIATSGIFTNRTVVEAGSNDDIPLVYTDGQSKQYYTATEGHHLRIECAPETVELTYTFAVDYEEKVRTGSLDLTLNEEGTKKIAKHPIFENGLIQYTAKIKKKDDSFIYEKSYEEVIKDIDYLAPKANPKKESYYYEDDILYYSMFIYDNISEQKLSAASGLGSIMVFYIDPDVKLEDLGLKPGEKITIEQLKALEGKGVGISYAKSYDGVATTQQQELQFKAVGKGVYFLYTMDRVGNVKLEALFNVNDTIEGGLYIGDSKQDCRPIIAAANKQADDGEGKYKVELLENLRISATNLRFSFDKAGVTVAEQQAAFRALVAAQSAYNNAEKKIKNLQVINADLFSGTIELTIRQRDIVMLLGEVITPKVIVGVYTELEVLDKKILSLAKVFNANKVIKLSYTLMKDNMLTVPENALVFHIALPDNYSDVAMVSGTKNTGFQKMDITKGTGWLEFSTKNSNMDFYMVVNQTENGANLLWLWILLGVVGGLLLIGLIVFFAVFYPKMAKKKQTTIVNSASEAATIVASDKGVAETVIKKPQATNKSKKAKGSKSKK